MEIQREICFDVSLSGRDMNSIKLLLGEKVRILKNAKLLVMVAIAVRPKPETKEKTCPA